MPDSTTITDLPPGAEIGPDGYAHGRDPRRMSQADLKAMGHQPMSALDAIRAHCLDCCCGSPGEVRACMARACPSWPFRMGVSPWKQKRTLTDEQRVAVAERLSAARAARSGGNAFKLNEAGAGDPDPGTSGTPDLPGAAK